MLIGFSTGSLAGGDVLLALRALSHSRATAVELSALREHELAPLVGKLDAIDLRQFAHVSFHAPSRLHEFSEAQVVRLLRQVAGRGWPVIVHPDLISDFSLWAELGALVCIENMDKRKAVGRTAAQLQNVFDKLPNATFCFDIGHARQVDPTMQEAESFLNRFRDRLRQVHMSYVNPQSGHERLNYESISAYRRVAPRLDPAIPVILETPVQPDEVGDEISAAEQVFAATTGQTA